MYNCQVMKVHELSEKDGLEQEKYSRVFSSATIHSQRNLPLTNYELNHLKRRPYICSVCSKGFTRKDSLQTHFHLHTGEKPYVCSICRSQFPNRASLKFHMKNHSQCF